ncbi:hypothetical protein [Nostoc sp. 'Lobaria pulmonaria (5183) cyanobiont']|nr:hypothetical protein [Nostoc sp. 'Lobaria pulmonaria (5183) cyanobiont']
MHNQILRSHIASEYAIALSKLGNKYLFTKVYRYWGKARNPNY